MKLVLKTLTLILLLSQLLFGCARHELVASSYGAADQEHPLPQNGLAVIEIRTHNGYGIIEKEKWHDASFILHGNGKFEDYSDSIQIKGRGNSTFRYPKLSFTIAFQKKHKLLNMQKSKKWVLLANYRDRTLMRNDIALFIGKIADMLEWTPSGEFVDVMFNGNYVGNYYLCEKINVNKQHVDIDEMKPEDIEGDNLTGGYLLQLDNYYDEANKFKTAQKEVPVEIISPNEAILQPEQFAYIEAYINTVESLIVAGEFAELYEKYIDLHSFVDYYIVQTLVGNNDFRIPHSVYLYKKRAGKLYAGPLWDFDFSTFYDKQASWAEGGWWYSELYTDPIFRSALKSRWTDLYPLIKNSVFDYIASRRQYIFLSALANFQQFEYDYSNNMHNIDDTGFIMALDKLVDVLESRMNFLNDKINAL